MGVQENGNIGDIGLSGVSLGSKNKYKRMDSEMKEDEDDDALHHHQEEDRRSRTKKYVFACAVFASLNSVLLGYGKCFLFFIFFLYNFCLYDFIPSHSYNSFYEA